MAERATARGIGRWLARLRRRQPDRDESEPAAPVERPGAMAAALDSAGDAPERRATVLVTVLGLEGPALENVLDLVGEEAASQPITPVFVTDSLGFDPFRRRRLRFEYFPDRGTRERYARDLDWTTYERRRYAALAEKWQAHTLISFGRLPPERCAEAVRARRPGTAR